jgi:hypothetical protein
MDIYLEREGTKTFELSKLKTAAGNHLSSTSLKPSPILTTNKTLAPSINTGLPYMRDATTPTLSPAKNRLSGKPKESDQRTENVDEI